MFVTLGEGWQGFGPKQPAGLTPKVANIIPGSPIAFEGMPTDGLLAGTVCLSPFTAQCLQDPTAWVQRGSLPAAQNVAQTLGEEEMLPVV